MSATKQIPAIASAVLALGSYQPQASRSLDPKKLRAKYLGSPAQVTRYAVLDTLISNMTENDVVLRRNARLLEGAVSLLTVAVLLLAVGAAIGMITNGDTDARQEPAPATEPADDATTDDATTTAGVQAGP